MSVIKNNPSADEADSSLCTREPKRWEIYKEGLKGGEKWRNILHFLFR